MNKETRIEPPCTLDSTSHMEEDSRYQDGRCNSDMVATPVTASCFLEDVSMDGVTSNESESQGGWGHTDTSNLSYPSYFDCEGFQESSLESNESL